MTATHAQQNNQVDERHEHQKGHESSEKAIFQLWNTFFP
jgi:hypothetical protein